jgi:hypothetical protein
VKSYVLVECLYKQVFRGENGNVNKNLKNDTQLELYNLLLQFIREGTFHSDLEMV